MADKRARTSVRSILRSLVVLAASLASFAMAQARFDVVTSDQVAGVAGLNVYTIRDNRTATCYTLFVLDTGRAGASGVPVLPPAPELSPEELEKVELAETLQDLRAERDRQLFDLSSRTMRDQWAFNFELERARIGQDYQSAVIELLPGLYPSAQVAPGLPTSSPEEVDAAVRRAIAEGQALAAPRSAVDERLLTLLESFATSQGLAPIASVSGPVPCPAAQ